MAPIDISTPGGRLIQIAFVTDDIRAEMARMTRQMKVGPWFLREHGVFQRQIYRGQPVETVLSIAMGYAGDMQFELIQQLDDGPSVYRDVVALRGYGLHHFGVEVDDFETGCAHYESEGFERAYDAEVANGARVAYFDTHERFAAMIEVIELVPATRAMFDGFRRTAIGWDGSDPIRPLAPVSSDA